MGLANMKRTGPFGTRPTDDLTKADLEIMLADYPSEVQKAVIRVIRGIFRTFPTNYYHWSADPNVTEVVVSSPYNRKEQDIPSKLHIMVGPGDVRWGNLSMNRAEPNLDFAGKQYSDLKGFNVLVQVISRNDKEAYKIGNLLHSLLAYDAIKRRIRYKAPDTSGKIIYVTPNLVRPDALTKPSDAGKILGDRWKGWWLCSISLRISLVHRALVGVTSKVYNAIIGSIDVILREQEPLGDITIKIEE